MANEFGANTIGLNEVDKMFKVLPKRTKNKIIPKALRFGAKPVVKSAKSKVPQDVTIKIKDGKSIKEFDSSDLKNIKVIIRGKPGDKYAVIGPDEKATFRNFGNWIEFGTLAHRTEPLKKKSRSIEGKKLVSLGVGLIKQPFMRPAIEENKKIVISRMEEKISTEIQREVEKILKRGKV